jgi:hypothetical protein
MLRYSLVSAYFDEDGRNPYHTGTNLNRYNRAMWIWTSPKRPCCASIHAGFEIQGYVSFNRWSQGGVKRPKSPTFYEPATARDEVGNLIFSSAITGQDFLGHKRNTEYSNNRIYFEAQALYDRTFADDHYVNPPSSTIWTATTMAFSLSAPVPKMQTDIISGTTRPAVAIATAVWGLRSVSLMPLV